jgi:hypothetical protein
MYMAPAFSSPGDVKHDVSDKMTCFWANVARCGRPNCAPCGTATWPAYSQERKEFLLFGPNGTFETRTVPSSGPVVVGDSFPSIEKCNWYMSLRTPFHDLRSDLDLDPTLEPRILDLGIRSAAGKSSAILSVALVAIVAF